MKESTLIKIRKYYYKLKNKYMKRSYFNEDEIEYINDDFRKKAYRKFFKQGKEPTNKIYYYLGTFKNSKNPNIKIRYILPRNSPYAEYSEYINIEDDLDRHIVLIDNREEFENSNKIVHIDGADNREYNYHFLKNMFIKISIESSQEQAILELMKMDNKNSEY